MTEANLRLLFILAALVALVAACVLMVDSRNSDALVTAVLFVGLVIAARR